MVRARSEEPNVKTPLSADSLGTPVTFTHYCAKCKNYVAHTLYSRRLTLGRILQVKCLGCGKELRVGDTIVKFVKEYCAKCKRKTVWIVYRYFDGWTTYQKIVCIGCGTVHDLGSV